MDYEQKRAELERRFQQFARENPFHPAVIKAIALRITRRNDEGPCECVKDWLALALIEPNNPRVLRVRKLIADRAAKRERLKNGPVFIEPFRLPLHMENIPWDAQQRHSFRNESSQSVPTTVEAENARQSSPESTNEVHGPMKTEHIDTSQLATILAALRFFEENYAFAVARYGKYYFEDQRALAVEEIDILCQTIIAAAVAYTTKIVGGLVSLRPDQADQEAEPKSNATPIPESDRPYPKLSDEQKEQMLDDVSEHLRITKAFKLFGRMHSGNSTVN